ncbi:MAG: Fe-S cluster assembly protein SufD [Alphaproteobacteria bacterium]|nr:Fe-S cluster assembly protein SufD [Alphaproteobacteria bacterium]
MQSIPTYLSQRIAGGVLPADLPGQQHAWLVQKREAALLRFLNNGLPTAQDEDWRYTHLRAIEKETFHLADQSTPTQTIEHMTQDFCGSAVFVDGILSKTLSKLDNLPAGLSVSCVREKLKGQQADDFFPAMIGADSWHDLNTALFDDGAVIDVAAGAVIEKPLEVICLSTKQNNATAYHAKNSIHLGENASLKIYKSKISNASHVIFSTHMNHITLQKGAKLQRIVLSKHADTTFTFVHDDVLIHEGAVFEKTAINLGGKIIRQKTTMNLAGENAYAGMNILTHTAQDGTTDALVDMRHNAPHTQSKQLIRSLAGGKARAVFQGKITVAQIAQKTDAAQNHQGMLLSDTAEIDAKPTLEIYADDVKCSHGNTCGALDETALFYLRSRGIPKEEAERLLQQAFIAELFEPFEESLRDSLMQRITDIIEKGAA